MRLGAERVARTWVWAGFAGGERGRGRVSAGRTAHDGGRDRGKGEARRVLVSLTGSIKSRSGSAFFSAASFATAASRASRTSPATCSVSSVTGTDTRHIPFAGRSRDDSSTRRRLSPRNLAACRARPLRPRPPSPTRLCRANTWPSSTPTPRCIGSPPRKPICRRSSASAHLPCTRVSVRRITFLSWWAESPTTGRHGTRDTKDVGGARATVASERVDRARVRASSGGQPGNASLVELAAS